MSRRSSKAALILLAGAALLAGCDKSPQSADGSTKAGDPGTAALPNGNIASTGSPEQGGANGTGPASVTPNSTINQLDRATPDAQSPGKANEARSP
jgi:uncharacterized lipoprotein YajG